MADYTHQKIASIDKFYAINSFTIILLSITLGIFIFVFPDVLLPLIFPGIASIIFYVTLKKDKGLVKIILIALWLRILFSIAYHSYLSSIPVYRGEYFNGFLFGPDGELYSGHGWWISLWATGKDVIKNSFIGKGGFYYDLYVLDEYIAKGMLIPMNSYQIGFLSYFYAILYSVFGYCPLLINFINCILGILIGYISYLIALKIFNQKIAYTTLGITLFFPSLFIWSALTKLKDPLFIFLSTLFLLSCIKFITEKKLLQLLLIILIIIVMDLIRTRSYYMLMPIFIASILIAIPISFKRKLLFLIPAFILINLFTPILLLIKPKIDALISYHYGSAAEGGVVYKLGSEISYAGSYGPTNFRIIDYIIFYFNSIFHLWFEPFPNHIVSKSLLVFYPQQLLWYISPLFFCIGIFTIPKKNVFMLPVILLYLFIISASVALPSANIGSMVRHRDLITPIIIIFSCAGFINLFMKKVYHVKGYLCND